MLDGISNLSTSRNFEILPTFTAGHRETLNGTSGTSGTSYTSSKSPDVPTYGKVATIVIGRARWDFAPQQWVGGIYSDREFLGSYSRFGGVDAPLQFGDNILFRPVAYFSDHRDLAGVRKTGYVVNPFLVNSGRNFGMTLYHFQISPGFATALGFIRQTDQASPSPTNGGPNAGSSIGVLNP